MAKNYTVGELLLWSLVYLKIVCLARGPVCVPLARSEKIILTTFLITRYILVVNKEVTKMAMTMTRPSKMLANDTRPQGNSAVSLKNSTRQQQTGGLEGLKELGDDLEGHEDVGHDLEGLQDGAVAVYTESL